MHAPRCGSRLLHVVLAAFVGTALLGAPRRAAANGRYPSADLLAVDPSNPRHLVVRATYGLLTTRDGGEVWRWICEPVVGYGGFEDPMVSILADGTIVAGVFRGLSASKSSGCSWSFAGDGLSGKFVVDLSTERADPSKAVLVVSNGDGVGSFVTQLWETSDSATTWTQAGVDLPAAFFALTVDTAPSDPARVYVSGRFGEPDYQGALERTSDRGRTWERLDIPGSDASALPYLSAIDPTDPNTLYVRLDGDPRDALLVSRDGGQTFSRIFEGEGNLLGFALSRDGATVHVGGAGGLFRASTSRLQFEQISGVAVRCLAWAGDDLLACADEATDGFTVGVSRDGGATFAPLMHRSGVCGPLDCDPSSGVTTVCSELWGATRFAISADEVCTPRPTSAASVVSTAISAAAGGGEGGGSSGSSGEGCGCRAAGADVAASGAARGSWLVLTLALVTAGRRRPTPRRRRAGACARSERGAHRAPGGGLRQLTTARAHFISPAPS